MANSYAKLTVFFCDYSEQATAKTFMEDGEAELVWVSDYIAI